MSQQEFLETVMKSASEDLRLYIEDRAAQIKSVDNRARALHDHMDKAADALLDLFALCHKLGLSMENNYSLSTLYSMFRDANGKRFIRGIDNGQYVNIDIDTIDQIWSKRKDHALKEGISVETVLAFERAKASPFEFESATSVRCNHPGCSVSKHLGFNSPKEMLEAQARASREIWFCSHHREAAFENDGVLADDLVLVLKRIAEQPGLTLTGTGAKKDEIGFLEIIGLVRSEKVLCDASWGKRVIAYKHFITENGKDVLDILSDRVNEPEDLEI